MAEQMELLSRHMPFEDIDMVAENRAVGPVSRLLRISPGSGELDVEDADVLPEGVQKIVHHVVGQGWMRGKHEDRYLAALESS